MSHYEEALARPGVELLKTTADAEAQAVRAIRAGMSLKAMRREYDETGIAPDYNGYQAVGLLSAVSLGAIILLIASIDQLSALEWAVLPVTLVYANLAEYALHRWIMHRPFPGLRKLFVRHALTHHRLYTDTAMPIARHRELQLILLPWYIIFVYMGLFITPMALIVGALISTDAACLFAIATLFYYWHYEFLHMVYHLPRDSMVYRWLPFMHRVARLHTRHHEHDLMANANFNHTYPLFDIVFGTWRR